MQIEKIWDKEEYNYGMAYGFEPTFSCYLQEEGEELRPAMIIVPGGGYGWVSPSEGELVAKTFVEQGYNAFVLTYTTNFLTREPLHLQPLKDLSRTIRYIRKNAQHFGVLSNQIAICGFSAGGHLCASLAVHYADIVEERDAYQGISNRPDACILSYPVITSGAFAHNGSFENLLGKNAASTHLTYMSLEKQVKPDTPPCFLWHTLTDQSVPVENSILFAEALKTQGILQELHLFSEGPHGLSLANNQWVSGRYGEYDTSSQLFAIEAAWQKGTLILSEEEEKKIRQMLVDLRDPEGKAERAGRKGYKAVAIWPQLAANWLQYTVGFFDKK